jgi:hypothetical protein
LPARARGLTVNVMRDDDVKAAVSEFMRHVGHTAQREIEKVLRKALDSGKLKRSEDLAAAITVHSEKLGLDVTIHSRIAL